MQRHRKPPYNLERVIGGAVIHYDNLKVGGGSSPDSAALAEYRRWSRLRSVQVLPPWPRSSLVLQMRFQIVKAIRLQVSIFSDFDPQAFEGPGQLSHCG